VREPRSEDAEPAPKAPGVGLAVGGSSSTARLKSGADLTLGSGVPSTRRDFRPTESWAVREPRFEEMPNLHLRRPGLGLAVGGGSSTARLKSGADITLAKWRTLGAPRPAVATLWRGPDLCFAGPWKLGRDVGFAKSGFRPTETLGVTRRTRSTAG
jgi:hypothetical protein